MDQATLGTLLALSFLPPLLFLVWVRNHERHQREPLWAVGGMFVYGGTLGVIIALALTLLFGNGSADPSGLNLVSLVVVAPLVEELAKGLGLGLIHNRIRETEDGIIYGAAIGLGFGATENLLYGLYVFDSSGVEAAAMTIGLRVFSSVILHASSSALLGYGYARMRLTSSAMVAALPFYLLAVAMHSLYNFLVGPQYLIGFAAAVVMVLVVATLLRRQIRRLDARPQLAQGPPL